MCCRTSARAENNARMYVLLARHMSECSGQSIKEHQLGRRQGNCTAAQTCIHHPQTPNAPTLSRTLQHYDRRQDNRVAARGIEKELRHSKVWMSAGDVFLRMSRADAKSVMKKDDETVADEIESVSIPFPL